MAERAKLERVGVCVEEHKIHHAIKVQGRTFRWFKTSHELQVEGPGQEWLTISVVANVDQAVGFVVGLYYMEECLNRAEVKPSDN